MLRELREQSLQENGSVIHPKISCMLFHKGDGFCLKHLKRNGMNIGSLKQHFRGKAHKTDPETGDLLHETNFLKIIKEARNQEDKKSRREEFDDNLHISKKISELKNTIYAMSVTKNELEGHWRTNMENLLIVRFGKEIGLVKDSDDYEFGI